MSTLRTSDLDFFLSGDKLPCPDCQLSMEASMWPDSNKRSKANGDRGHRLMYICASCGAAVEAIDDGIEDE